MGKVISSLFNNTHFYEQIFKPQVKHTINTYKPSVKIIKQGIKYPYFCFIKSGTLRVVLNEDVSGKNVIHTVIATLEKNDFVGEFKLFNDYPASADVITVTETEIVLVDIKSFKKYLDTDPEMGYNVLLEMMQSIIKRMHHSNKTVLHLLKSAIDFQKQLHQLIGQR